MIKLFRIFSIIFIATGITVACSNSSTNNEGDQYHESSSTFNAKEVKIGNQVWLAENLNVATFRNGDSIPESRSQEDWIYAGKNSQPTWCYFYNDTAKGSKYGRLYNWYAVNDPRNLAPVGWHISSNDEWNTLVSFLGEEAEKKIKSKSGWTVNNGNNSSGFSGLPGGMRSDLGIFVDADNNGYWWCSHEDFADFATKRCLLSGSIFACTSYDKGSGLSVRCLKD